MINLPVSEAYALDYLAILMVKEMKGLQVQPELNDTKSSLRSQIGEETMDCILRSWDFRELVNTNETVFRMVSLAASDDCKASEVDRANQRRYEAKKALQERFWPSQPLSEIKADRP